MADDSVAAVHTLGRRPLAFEHPKLTQHVVDFRAFDGLSTGLLPPLPAVQEVFLALGTTIKAAGSQQAFRAVDHDANLAVARAALAQGASRLGLVSAMGADPQSRIFYNRVKGELERDVQQLQYAGLVIARPSFLVGDREALGQPRRPGETLALAASRRLGWLIPDDYKAIEAAQVAAAMLRTVPSAEGARVLSSGQMRRIAPAAAAPA
ncbi:nucleoside-diphosphate sugar epimerase [Caenimonas terrae]|uniref:Nucleoside-diphosphate sugar epimerase n=1 Tax=Caenimonas terrae TaxID=696074 RepID=A0ABW0NBS6_9BURK